MTPTPSPRSAASSTRSALRASASNRPFVRPQVSTLPQAARGSGLILINKIDAIDRRAVAVLREALARVSTARIFKVSARTARAWTPGSTS